MTQQTFKGLCEGVNWKQKRCIKHADGCYKSVAIGSKVRVYREKENTYSANALKVETCDGCWLGYIEQSTADHIASMDSISPIDAVLEDVSILPGYRGRTATLACHFIPRS